VNRKQFANWTHKVNFRLSRHHGIDPRDFDPPYWRLYEMGCSPSLAVSLIVEELISDGYYVIDEESSFA